MVPLAPALSAVVMCAIAASLTIPVAVGAAGTQTNLQFNPHAGSVFGVAVDPWFVYIGSIGVSCVIAVRGIVSVMWDSGTWGDCVIFILTGG